MVSRSGDWFRQAVRDLEFAKRALEDGFYEWACLIAHQAAEKAVKALHQMLGNEVWGHSVSRLLQALPEESRPPRELVEMAKELDQHYIPSRYPNAHPEGAPMDYYTREQAERAISYASEILEWVRGKVVQA
ncbi:MAG: HEPN domain-containing protein [Candidatus Korarchaeota archaeon]|nr:HEPN domain-containing protein [Candidatus Korarchaeota archaeon]